MLNVKYKLDLEVVVDNNQTWCYFEDFKVTKLKWCNRNTEFSTDQLLSISMVRELRYT